MRFDAHVAEQASDAKMASMQVSHMQTQNKKPCKEIQQELEAEGVGTGVGGVGGWMDGEGRKSVEKPYI